MCLVEQPQSRTFCKGTLASIEEKEESLKEACIYYFTYIPRYPQVKFKLSIGNYQTNKETLSCLIETTLAKH